MKQPPFRWIETFRVIAGAGSMTDAAKILGVDQSAMSRHIASLESQLGISLFDRSKRRLRLTAEGKLLLAEADSAAEALNRFVRKANQIRRVSDGHLQVLTSATLARGIALYLSKRTYGSHWPFSEGLRSAQAARIGQAAQDKPVGSCR
jgi:DNA-binding transcriptional LysR family regulator